MKSAALGLLLFCGLAAVLGYVAANGIGARAPGFASGHVLASLPPPATGEVQQATPKPDVTVRSEPIDRATVRTSAKVAPATVVTVRRARPRVRRSPRSLVARSAPEKAAVSKPSQPAKSVVAERPKPKPSKVFVIRPTPEPVAEQPVIVRRPSVDATGDSVAADHAWVQRTLERWRRAGDGNADEVSARARPDSSLDGTPAEGMYRADDDKPKKRKKLHRFLFIKWRG